MPSTFPKNKNPFDWPPEFYQKVMKQGYNYEHLDYSGILLYLKSKNTFSYAYDALIPKSKLEVLGSAIYNSFNPQLADEFVSNLPGSIFKPKTDLKSAFNRLSETGYTIDEVDDFRMKAICNIVPGKISLSKPGCGIQLELVQIGTNFILYFYIPYESVDVDQPDQEYAMIVGTSHVWSAAYLIRYANIQLTEPNKNVIRKIYKFLFKDAGDDRNKLDIIYYWAPQFILNEKSEDSLFNDLDSLLNGFVDETGTNEEVAVLKIVESFTSIEKLGEVTANNPNATRILDKLLTKKEDTPTILYRLYNSINNYGGEDNFTSLLDQLYVIWLLSEHFAREPIYPIDYTSEKTLGFYFTSHDFELRKDSDIVRIYNVDDLTYEPAAAVYQTMIFESDAQIDVEGQESVPDIMPAFYLKGLDDRNKASNFESGFFLAVDLLTTFTGFGNLLKFKKLFSLLKMTEGVYTVSKGLVITKTIIAGVEVTSGAVGAMMTLSDNCDSPFCRSLRSCLFYMDIFSLGIDVVISKLLKKSAREALDAAGTGMRNAENEEMFKLLEEFAGVKTASKLNGEELLRKLDNIFDASGGRILTKEELLNLKSILQSEYGVTLRFIDQEYRFIHQKTYFYKGQKISKLEYWNQTGYLGSFKAGPPPEMFLRMGPSGVFKGTSELTVFHEMVHVLIWSRGGSKVHPALEEVLVFDEIWKTKESWTKKELFDSYNYVVQELKDNKFLEELNAFRQKYGSSLNLM